MMAKNTDDYAVIVGVSHYKGLKILSGPQEDAERFEAWLKDPKGGNLPEDNCHLIQSKEDAATPIQDTIDDCFEEIFNIVKVTPGRRLYFYFSGHGIGLEWDVTALVLPKWTKTRRNSALSGKAYHNMLIESATFREIFFFLDCCRNQEVSVKGAIPQLGNIDAEAAAGGVASYIFSATEFGNKAYEADIAASKGSLPDDSTTRGLFTTSLIKGLMGAAEMDGQITTLSLSNHLKEDLPKLVYEKVKKVQKPQLLASDDGGGTIILDNIPKREIQLEIKFTTQGKNVVLLSPDMESIPFISSLTEILTLKVKKGTYVIYYEDDIKSLKTIEIPGNKNIERYEF